jgi:hypothetical protein
VEDDRPIRWSADPARLAAKKALKQVMATAPGRATLHLGCRVLERLGPDTRWSHRAYDLAVAVAIFRGVREGLRRYGEDPASPLAGGRKPAEN